MTVQLPPDNHASWKRCPKTSCEDYGKRLYIEVGQHESLGELTVEHRCITCQYVEFGPANPTAAKKTSRTVRSLAALLMRQRLGGVEIPLVYSPEPFPKGEFDG